MIIWDISPVAVELSVLGLHLAIRWYGLFFASCFAYGISLFLHLYRIAGKNEEHVYDLSLCVMAGTLLGARLGHVLFYDPGYYLNHPLEILYLWEGGLASHGAVLGILLAIFLYSRFRPDESFLWICDRVGMAVPFSGCLIRLGNFFNSEILGTPSDVPWAVVFARVDAIPRHPVQLYESLSYLLVFIAQYHFFKRNHGQPPLGELFGRFFVGVFGVRFVLEFFKEEQASFALGGILTMGQWLSIPAVAAGLGCIAWSRRRETNR